MNTKPNKPKKTHPWRNSALRKAGKKPDMGAYYLEKQAMAKKKSRKLRTKFPG